MAIACSALEAGDALVELGDTGWLMVSSDMFIKGDMQAHLHAGCHTLDSLWTLESSNVTSGAGLEWLLKEVCSQEALQAKRAKRAPVQLLAELAADIPPGADGLLYIPPETPDDIGSLIDQQKHHSRPHIIRAVLESSALALADRLDLAESLGAPCKRLMVTGPGADVTRGAKSWPMAAIVRYRYSIVIYRVLVARHYLQAVQLASIKTSPMHALRWRCHNRPSNHALKPSMLIATFASD